jgi:nicotinamidase/pyrazinamidase
MDHTVFFDVDTQIDFLLPVGALYVPGAEAIIPMLAQLTEYARARGIAIVSSADAHAPQDPEFREWPPHCVAGTLGQRKVPETLLANPVVIPNTGEELPQGWDKAAQVIVEKQTTDVFQTRTIGRILAAYPKTRFVMYGVVTEVCVLHAAEGLLKRGAHLDIVTDAVRELDPKRSHLVLHTLRGRGAHLMTTAQVMG